MSARIAACVRCRQTREIKYVGECSYCYAARFAPRTGNPHGRGVSKSQATIAGRIEDYLELLSYGEEPLTIAQRLGVSRRTLHRYDARLRQEAS